MRVRNAAFNATWNQFRAAYAHEKAVAAAEAGYVRQAAMWQRASRMYAGKAQELVSYILANANTGD